MQLPASYLKYKLFKLFMLVDTGRCRNNARIIMFFLCVQRCDTLYSHTPFMLLNCLLQGLNFLQTGFAVVPPCFACFVAYQDVNRHDFALSIVMMLLNQAQKVIYHILRSYLINKSAKRDSYVLRFPTIYHMP